jgi:broad specificity phosphatase PhoE
MCSAKAGTVLPYPLPTLPSVLARLFLVRHGEVHNPDHICYGDLPGFRLSPAGRGQALAAADYLASFGAGLLLCSPLPRARETAGIIGPRLGLVPITDDRLTEWRLGVRWAGTRWEDLPAAFPGELEAYLDHPADLPFAPESIAAAAERVAALVDELGRSHPGEQAILVSHQDPIQAARLLLTGGPLTDLPTDKPGHGAVFTLEPGAPWRLTGRWEPPQPGSPFPPLAGR